ncbi:MAG: hypothetical protein OEZ45_05940, partial [Candidatus Aminicenantes bacterium]|nr:hypothetical protein [Candidatus Aminicenantes bacterium]
PEGRGTRETEPHFYLDLGVQKEISLGSLRFSPNMSLLLRLDVFNILDSQEPISYIKEDIPIFGEVWARQQPRQARILIKLKW